MYNNGAGWWWWVFWGAVLLFFFWGLFSWYPRRSNRDDYGAWRATRSPYGPWPRAYPYEGPHKGRGPRGYTRSDDRIVEDINDELTRSGDVDATDIVAVSKSGVVTLTGSVNTREEKRSAEEITDSIAGVVDVNNQLQVRRASNVQPTTPEHKRSA